MLTSRQKIHAHIARVRELMEEAIVQLGERALEHDESKFDPEELGPLEALDALIEREGQAPFGTPEYVRRTAMLGPMLEHHYAHNSHHPEHFEQGVAGMTLLDVLEMLIDWKAASERGEESAMNLTVACARFKIEPQLAAILYNTARHFGWAVENRVGRTRVHATGHSF